MPDVNNTDVIDTFWDTYVSDGIEPAMAYVKEQTDGDLTILETAVPYLVEEARTRDIDMIDFLQELDAFLENEDASRTNNGGSELPSDSSGETDQSQNENEPAQARDADAEGGDREQES